MPRGRRPVICHVIVRSPHHLTCMLLTSSCATCPVRTVRTGTINIKFFTCLAWRTDRDIFSIRSPFDKVNILPESGRRDEHNGTVFVAFRALWNLSKIWSPDQWVFCTVMFLSWDGEHCIIVSEHLVQTLGLYETRNSANLGNSLLQTSIYVNLEKTEKLEWNPQIRGQFF